MGAAKEELEDIDENYSEVRSKKVAVDVIGKDEYLFMLYHMGQVRARVGPVLNLTWLNLGYGSSGW